MATTDITKLMNQIRLERSLAAAGSKKMAYNSPTKEIELRVGDRILWEDTFQERPGRILIISQNEKRVKVRYNLFQTKWIEIKRKYVDHLESTLLDIAIIRTKQYIRDFFKEDDK